LQSHKKRQEQWVVVKGEATVTLDDEVVKKGIGETVFIPTGVRHRLGNDTDDDIELIEVQTGSYFGEDDIVRYEDDFQRLT
jgi:mannose-6-phosphate isomerase-like protein (cupin superfamily)